MAGYLDLEGGELRRSIFLAAKTFDTHLRIGIVYNNMSAGKTVISFITNSQRSCPGGAESADGRRDEAPGCGGRTPARAKRPVQRCDRREAGADHRRGRQGTAAGWRAAGGCGRRGSNRQADRSQLRASRRGMIVPEAEEKYFSPSP